MAFPDPSYKHKTKGNYTCRNHGDGEVVESLRCIVSICQSVDDLVYNPISANTHNGIELFKGHHGGSLRREASASRNARVSVILISGLSRVMNFTPMRPENRQDLSVEDFLGLALARFRIDKDIKSQRFRR